jgi:hydroxymethylpyrimidine/phosphomethylpyrimidine kinase
MSDPVGALGIQADLAAFAAHGCHGLSVVTGILIADSARVEDMQEVDADLVMDQARALLEDMPVAAFKIGALANVEQAAAIAEIVSDYTDVPLILDPFLSALPDSGLLDDDMVSAIRQILAPQASVLMVSQVELARMAETWRETPSDDMLADIAELTASGCASVLMTGLGSSGGTHFNALYDAQGLAASVDWQLLPGPFVGAGSTLSAALAALMAHGLDAADALRLAQVYTTGALATAQRFGMGKLVPNKFFRTAPAAGA